MQSLFRWARAGVLAGAFCAGLATACGDSTSEEDSTTTAAALATSYETFEGFSTSSWAEGSTHGNWNLAFDGFGSAGIKQLSSTYSKVLYERPAAPTSAGETHAALVRGTESFGDLDVQVSLKTITQLRAQPNPWEMAWFVWHYTDDAHFYYFILKPNGWELGKRDPAYPGGQRFLATGGSPAYPPGAWHAVHVQQSAATMQVSADGVSLAAITDAERPYLNGVLGFYSEDASVQFDNVVLDATATSTSATTTTTTTTAKLYGVTVDDISMLGDITASLSALPQKPTTRIVFDEGEGPAYYASAVPAIHGVSQVMGEILDSYYVKNVTTAQYTQRTKDYLAAFPSNVDIWEVGNEINGNWLGATSDVVAKMTGAFDLVKAAGRPTELTLYGCSDSGASYDLLEWTKANVPARMLSGLDYVLVSYYEGDCGNPRSDWQSVFDQLRQLFPNAALGFGEVGAVDSNGQRITDTSIAGPYLTKYYDMKITTPGYVGGYFWWYFAEDMVPQTQTMFSVLSSAITATP